VHILHRSVDILQSYPEDVQLKIRELTSYKIDFDKRSYANNMKILKVIAQDGPMLKYGIQKATKLRDSTTSRRVDFLYEEEYLGEADTRQAKRGTQSENIMYGLTWKGFFAGLSLDEIRYTGTNVLKKNPLLNLPEKELILTFAEEIWGDKQLALYFDAVFFGYLFSNAPPLKDIKENDLQGWLIPILRTGTNLEFIRDIELDIKTDTRNLLSLLDNPEILYYVKTNLVPKIAEYERNLRESFNLFRMLNDLGKYVSQLEVTDSPSKRLMEYMEGEFSTKFENFDAKLEDSS